MAEKPTVGWIGTGRMGYALARRLLEAGYDVAVYNRTRTKAESLGAFGATIVDEPVELAGRDIVFSMVSTSDDLQQVILGENGLLADVARSPKIIADASRSRSKHRRSCGRPQRSGARASSRPRSPATRKSSRWAS